MSGTTQIDYDLMQGISTFMSVEGEQIKELVQKTQSTLGSLRDGKKWEGDAANKFFSEMEQTILPAVSRLAHAWETCSVVAREITDTIRKADEETQGFFKNFG